MESLGAAPTSPKDRPMARPRPLSARPEFDQLSRPTDPGLEDRADPEVVGDGQCPPPLVEFSCLRREFFEVVWRHDLPEDSVDGFSAELFEIRNLSLLIS